MVYDSSRSSALTETRIDIGQKKPDTIDQIELPSPRFRVRRLDGSLTEFNITSFATSLEDSLLAAHQECNLENQSLIGELSMQIANMLIRELPADGIVDINDVHVQIEMTLTLNNQTALVDAYFAKEKSARFG